MTNLILSPFVLDRIRRHNLLARCGQRDVTEATIGFASSCLAEAKLAALAHRAPRMSVDEATDHVGVLGFFVASLEFQRRRNGGCLNSTPLAFARFPGLEGLMLALGQRAGRVPRDDAASIWLNNPPYSFTGTPGEARFGQGVRHAERLLGAAADILAPLRRGAVTLANALPNLVSAISAVRTFRRILQDMVKNPFPEDFGAMRDCLVAYSVGGIAYEPPNATNAPGWNRADIAIGNHGALFLQALPGRIRAMSAADAAAVKGDLALPSVMTIAANQIGLDHSSLLTSGDEEIMERLEGAAPEVQPSLAAACDLARENAIMIGTHFAVIQANLVKPAAAAGHRADVATHSAAAGVSGRPLSETDALRRSRKDHPLARTRWRPRA